MPVTVVVVRPLAMGVPVILRTTPRSFRGSWDRERQGRDLTSLQNQN